jgi:hypothetical protein
MEQLKNIVETMPVHVLMRTYYELSAKLYEARKPQESVITTEEYSALCKHYAIIGARVRKIMMEYDETY